MRLTFPEYNVKYKQAVAQLFAEVQKKPLRFAVALLGVVIHMVV